MAGGNVFMFTGVFIFMHQSVLPFMSPVSRWTVFPILKSSGTAFPLHPYQFTYWAQYGITVIRIQW